MSAIVINTSLVTHEPSWIMDLHLHPGLEISVVLEGRGSFTFGEVVYPLETGHVVMIPAHLPHTYSAETTIRFAVSMVENMPNSSLQIFNKLVPNQQPVLYWLSLFDLDHYLSLFRVWVRELSGQPANNDSYIAGWVHLFLMFLNEHTQIASPTMSVSATADYIRSNLGTELTIAELAKSTGLSESTFRAMFKKTFGMTPKNYLHICRMSETKLQLRTTNRPLQQIAEQIGFSGIHAFSAWFQHIEGVSPSEWRKRQQII